MADEPIEDVVDDDDEIFEATKKKGGLLPKLLTLIVGVGIGGGVGMFTVGPMVGARMAATPAGAGAGDAPADDGHGGGGDHGEEVEAGSEFHLIENLVVNPAQSEGTRFLLISIAVQMEDASDTEVLVERDMELRDALLRSLGRHTVAELADINARDFLTDELKVALQSVLQLRVNRILIPQFVIQ